LDLKNIIKISAGQVHSLFLNGNGRVFATGANSVFKNVLIPSMVNLGMEQFTVDYYQCKLFNKDILSIYLHLIKLQWFSTVMGLHLLLVMEQ
jgi:alpha-tubulin suppressor-like RCC1 family protein